MKLNCGSYKNLGSDVEVNVEILVKFVKFISYLLAHLSDMTMFTIVENAVVEHQLDIMDEILHLGIFIGLKILLDCSKVHWFLNDIKVIRDVIFHRIYWFMKKKSLRVLPEYIQQSLGCFIPAIIYRGILRNIWNREIV